MEPKTLEQIIEFGKFAGMVMGGAAIAASFLAISIHYLIKYDQKKYQEKNQIDYKKKKIY